MNSLADQYYLKAVGFYPHSLEDVVESLGFALSYENDHVGANHLMGKVYAEQFGDYSLAESYYQAALASDPLNENVCLDYVLLYIVMKEFDKAEKLIAYTRNIKGVDLARVFHYEGLSWEVRREYDLALLYYEEALLESYNQEYTSLMNAEINRVKAKQKLRKTTSST